MTFWLRLCHIRITAGTWTCRRMPLHTSKGGSDEIEILLNDGKMVGRVNRARADGNCQETQFAKTVNGSIDSNLLDKAMEAPLPPYGAIATLLTSQHANASPESFPLPEALAEGESATRQTPKLRPENRGWISTRPPGRLKAEPWLAQALRGRWESYADRLHACRERASADSVHELRVATRRLISQVILFDSIFCSGKAQRTLRLLKRHLESLGALRDHHVQQILIEQQTSRFPELLALKRHLDRRQQKLIRAASRRINRFRNKKLEKWIGAMVAELAQDSNTASGRNRATALALRRAGEAFSETLARRRSIDYSDLKTIHRTRVAFKKFRYIVESLPGKVTGLSKRDLRQLAYYQRKMGNIQDLEVLQAYLTDFLERHEANRNLLAPFCAYLRRRRTHALRSFRKSADEIFRFWPPPCVTGGRRRARAYLAPQ